MKKLLTFLIIIAAALCLLCASCAEELPEMAATDTDITAAASATDLPLPVEQYVITAHNKNNKDVVSFSTNTLIVEVPCDGDLTIYVKDKLGNYFRQICADQPVTAGKLTLTWNGLGYNGEKLDEGNYLYEMVLATENGIVTGLSRCKVGRAKNAILFAMGSADTLYNGGKWFVETRMLRAGTLIIEIYDADNLEKPLQTRTKKYNTQKIITWSWNGKLEKKLEPGDYVLRFYEKTTPSYCYDVKVTVSAEAPPKYKLQETGEIMPADGATDEEIWALMTAPAVVVNIKAESHQNVHAWPDYDSDTLGRLHGASQCVKLINIGRNWAKIGAYRHEDGQYIEGYVPLKVLKVVEPRTEYGLLVDKRAQTLTVFHEGKRMSTITISTGLMTKAKPYHETPAGSYLTNEHMVDYGMNGKRYQYVIRYSGGNLLHSIAFKKHNGMRDYSLQTATLGQKASNGCLRLQPMPGEEGVNAYWIWTHIPFNTRLIILDDPEVREMQMLELGIPLE